MTLSSLLESLDITAAENNLSKISVFPHGEGSSHEIHEGSFKRGAVPLHKTIGNEPEKDARYARQEAGPHVQRMAKRIRKGGSLPPAVAIKHPEDPTKALVLDGNHRRHAYRLAGKKNFPIELHSHAAVHLMHHSYDDEKEGSTPLTHFAERNGMYDMDKPRKELKGRALKHYFARPDGSHSFSSPTENQRLHSPSPLGKITAEEARSNSVPFTTKEQVAKHNAVAADHAGMRKVWRTVANKHLSSHPEDHAGAIKVANSVIKRAIRRNHHHTSINNVLSSTYSKHHSFSVMTPRKELGEHGKLADMTRLLNEHGGHSIGILQRPHSHEHFVYVPARHGRNFSKALREAKISHHCWGAEGQEQKQANKDLPFSFYSQQTQNGCAQD